MPPGERPVRVGLTLHGSLLSDDGARFARQLGVRDVVIHLTDYARGADPRPYLAGGTGPINGECIDAPLWSYEHMAGIVAMLARHGLRVARTQSSKSIRRRELRLRRRLRRCRCSCPAVARNRERLAVRVDEQQAERVREVAGRAGEEVGGGDAHRARVGRLLRRDERGTVEDTCLRR